MGAVSGAFMIRKGNWKLVHYEGFAPQLFDLKAEPDEIKTLAALRNMKISAYVRSQS